MLAKSFLEVNQVLQKYMPRAGSVHDAYTLERMERLVELLDNPQEAYKTVHVAGTSGKTSTAYYVAGLLKESAQKVGLTISPHIDEVNERVQIDLQLLPEAKYCKYFNQFIKLVEKSQIHPTYFELLVAFAFWVFAREKVDYAVVEVGLGGLLDGTNVIKRPDKTCILTDIGLDHTDVLGQKIEEITAQKAGIIHAYNPVFAYDQGEEVMQVIREVCEQEQAELHEVWPLGGKELPHNLPLFQRRNWYLAWSTYQFVALRDKLPPLRSEQLQKSTEVYIPVRMEVISKGKKTVVLDGAHNAQKMRVLNRSLQHAFPKRSIAVLLALKQSKNFQLRTHLQSILDLADHVIITAFESTQDNLHQSVKPLKIAEYLGELGFDNWEIVDDPRQAYKILLKRPEEVLLITGSLYLMSHITPLVFKGVKIP